MLVQRTLKRTRWRIRVVRRRFAGAARSGDRRTSQLKLQHIRQYRHLRWRGHGQASWRYFRAFDDGDTYYFYELGSDCDYDYDGH